MKKRLLYLLVLLSITAFVSSCEKLEANGINRAIVGKWVNVDEVSDDGGIVYYYMEFTESGLYYEWYCDNYKATSYSNGTIYTSEPCKWKKEFVAPYDIRDGYLFILGGYYLSGGPIQVKNDKLIFYEMEDEETYAWERVKQIQ